MADAPTPSDSEDPAPVATTPREVLDKLHAAKVRFCTACNWSPVSDCSRGHACICHVYAACVCRMYALHTPLRYVYKRFSS